MLTPLIFQHRKLDNFFFRSKCHWLYDSQIKDDISIPKIIKYAKKYMHMFKNIWNYDIPILYCLYKVDYNVYIYISNA